MIQEIKKFTKKKKECRSKRQYPIKLENTPIYRQIISKPSPCNCYLSWSARFGEPECEQYTLATQARRHSKEKRRIHQTVLHVVWTLPHLIVLQPYFWCLLNISGWNLGLNVFLYIIGLTSRFWSLKTVPGYSETHDSDMRRINPHTVNRKWRKTTSCSMNLNHLHYQPIGPANTTPTVCTTAYPS